MNFTQYRDSSGISTPFLALRTLIIAIIGLLIISGNILCLAVIRRITTAADSTKVLMTSVAVSDLLAGCFTVLDLFPSALDRWPFGAVGCEIVAVAKCIVYMMTITAIVFINIERCLAITKPFKFQMWCINHRVTILVVGSWIFVSLIVISLKFILKAKSTVISSPGPSPFYLGYPLTPSPFQYHRSAYVYYHSINLFTNLSLLVTLIFIFIIHWVMIIWVADFD